MAALTPVKPTPASFYVPVVAAAGGFAGIFVGTAQGATLLGLVAGAALLAGIALLLA